MPQFGIHGAAIGTATGFAVASLLNLISLKKYTHFNIKLKTLVYKPIIAVLIMGITVKQGFPIIVQTVSIILPKYSYTVGTFGIVFIAGLGYALMLILLKEIKYSDIALIPKIGQGLADRLQQIGMVGDE
jgi:stage V sporulation protein B